MALEIKRQPLVAVDIEQIWLSIALDNFPAAERWLDQLHDAFDRLAEFPELGPARPEFSEGLRSWPLGGAYVIFYRVEPDTIDIVRVLHGARDLPGEFQAP